jgi:hypothetical protein
LAGALSITVVNARPIAATEPFMTASIFLIQKPDNFLVSRRHSALFATGVERISGGNGQAERMTVAHCITKNAVIFGAQARAPKDDASGCGSAVARTGAFCGLLRNLRADAPDAG